MRTYPDPNDEYERREFERLNAPRWMADCLMLNPEYVHWGPHEDYMWKKGDGWDSPVLNETWKDFGPWELDDMNECVHFYFQIGRDSKDCPSCGGSGYHPDAHWVEKSWYRHSSPFTLPTRQERLVAQGMHERFGSPLPVEIHGRGTFPPEETLKKYGPEFRAFCEQMRDGDGFWSDKITQDEVEALVKSERLHNYTHEFAKGEGWKPKKDAVNPTAAQINADYREGMGHDAINQSIVVRRRLERYGMPHGCPECEGHGSVFTAPNAHLTLVMWFLHPRKGASRGVEVKRIQQDELPEVYKYLKSALARNSKRFEKVAAAV